MNAPTKRLALVLLLFVAAMGTGCGPDCLYLEIRFIDPSGEWISVEPYTVELEVGNDRLELAFPVPFESANRVYDVGGFPFRFAQNSIYVDAEGPRSPRTLKISLRSEDWAADAVIRPDYSRDPEPGMEDCSYAFEELHLVPRTPTP